MKNGYRYNISIVAKSQVYAESQILNGDTYTGEVKTVVKSKFLLGCWLSGLTILLFCTFMGRQAVIYWL